VLSCGLLWPGWLEDPEPWCGASCLPVGAVPVAVIPVVVAQEPSQCGRPPKGGFFLALGPGTRLCLCPIGAVGLSLCVCMCVHVCVCLFVSLSLWVFMGVGGFVCFIIVVFSLCEALLKYERCHTNKI